jgi:S-DNA-T family DNA segregation ATPase FtsK/SpoIIIE
LAALPVPCTNHASAGADCSEQEGRLPIALAGRAFGDGHSRCVHGVNGTGAAAGTSAATGGRSMLLMKHGIMFSKRNPKTDLVALGLLAVTVFLAASLLSYNPADPPSKLVCPERTTTANLCGRSGAWTSTLLFNGLGVGAYYLLVSMAVVDAVLLARREIGAVSLRLVGWLLSLVGLSTLAAMALAGLSPGPVIGSGGYLGAAMRGLLERHFAATGAYIILASLILGGLLLSSDYVLLKVLAWTVGAPVRGLSRGAVRVGRAYAGKMRPRKSDLDSAEEGAELDDACSRIPVTTRALGQKPDEEKDDVQDEEEGGATAPSKPSPKEAASPLKIRKPKKNRRAELLGDIVPESAGGAVDYELPSPNLLLESEPFCFEEQEQDVRRKAKILEKTFADFGFNVRVVEIQTGPVIAQFEVELEAGLRLSRITGLADDLAIALRVPSVRIVAPIPGKNTVGLEVPNSERKLVRLREVMEEADGRVQAMRIPIFLGKDVAGSPMVVDLSTLPHLLIAGRTGTGKSVCLNSIIVSILMTRRPDEVRMLLIDPKMVELSPYKNIPHLMHPVVTDMRKAEAILGWAVEKMEDRYQLLARAGVRHVSVYNQLGIEEILDRIRPVDDEERKSIPAHMPYIVMVADEMADLMMTAAKEVEGHIIRLAQKSRAVGIHLVLATQKPTVDVITGLIKSNLPARISFQVASRTDSRVVLDEMGADKLLSNGDMLFLWPGTSNLIRGQGTFLSDDEIGRVIDSVATSEPQYVKELVQLKASEPSPEGRTVQNRDDLYEAAVDLVVREGRGSCSLLQRALGIGYGRAARLIDFMAEDGIVGTYNGSQAREVLISLQQWDDMRQSRQEGQSFQPPAPRRPSNRILMGPAPLRAGDGGEGDREPYGPDADDGERDFGESGEQSDGEAEEEESEADEDPEEDEIEEDREVDDGDQENEDQEEEDEEEEVEPEEDENGREEDETQHRYETEDEGSCDETDSQSEEDDFEQGGRVRGEPPDRFTQAGLPSNR